MKSILLAGLVFSATVSAAETPNLRVIATNVQSDEGQVIVWVYDNKDDWLSDRYRTFKSVKVAGNRVGNSVTLELLLPPGEYALSVFQDVDNDTKLKSNFIGLPKEPAALSNNLRPKFGPPRYKDAVFTIGNKLVGILAIHRFSFRLSVRRIRSIGSWTLIKIQPAPVQRINDILLRVRHVAVLVGVFNAQQKSAIVFFRE